MSTYSSAATLLLLSCCLPLCSAGQVPGPAAAADIPISSRDRLYLSDQTSNAVSVVDPATNKLLGVIQLGGKLPETLSAVYRGQSLVHGMGFNPDHTTLAVVCVASNAIVFVDTSNNTVKHIAYVGRAPHEAMWTPDGREVWVTVRGEDYIQVLDGESYAPKRRVQVPSGPGMTIFSPDGKYAYICSSFTPETVVVDTATYSIVSRIKQASPFCPNIAATPDGAQVWFTLKDTGKVQVFNGRPPFNSIAVLETGPITNHVNFARTSHGQFAYVTVGGERAVKVFTTQKPPKFLTTIADVGANPHGLWPSGDGSRMYVGLQLGNAVTVIDTSGKPSANKVLQTVDVGAQAPMALMYVPQAIPASGFSGAAGSINTDANLVPAAVARKAAKGLYVGLVPAAAAGSSGASSIKSLKPLQQQQQQVVVTSVAVNNQGFTDSLEAAVTGLQPGQQYILGLADNPDGTGDIEPLASFIGGKDGAASVAVLGPFRSMLLSRSSKAGSIKPAGTKQAKYLVIAELVGTGDDSKVGSLVQVQQAEIV